MFRTIFIVALAFAASVAAVDTESCKSLMNPELVRCCPGISFERGVSAHEACGSMPLDPTTCTREICIGTKLGYADSNGKIDKAKLKDSMAIEFSGQPELLEVLKSNCIDEDLSRYGSSEDCDLHKMGTCFMFQFIAQCPKWLDEDMCKGKQEMAKECSSFM